MFWAARALHWRGQRAFRPAERRDDSPNPRRDGDRSLEFLIFNEECLVGASHQLASITSLPFVHTARRSYRLGVLVKCSDWQLSVATPSIAEKFIKPSHLEEGEVVTRFP